MRTLLVIEEAEADDVCAEVAETTLLGVFEVRRAQTPEAALMQLADTSAEAILITLPFKPAARRSIWPWRRESSDTRLELVRSTLEKLRGGGHEQRVIVHELPRDHLQDLRDRFGDVRIIAKLGAELREALGERRATAEDLAALVRFGESIGRTVRSSASGVPDRMVEMFIRHVYGDDESPSASARFAELDPGDFRLRPAHEMLEAIDAQEVAARARDLEALRIASLHVRSLVHLFAVLTQ